MVKEMLKVQLQTKYGDFTPVPLTGGYTNQTFLLKGTDPLLVVKISSKKNLDFINEENALTLTKETGIVPFFYERIETEDFHLLLMEYKEGTNAQTILDTKDLETTKQIYKLLGEHLSNAIHSKRYMGKSEGINVCNINDMTTIQLKFVPKSLIHESKKILDTLNDRDNKWVLTHGDYGVHNVLYSDNQTISILDWEWAEWANPLSDIAWNCWFTRLHYPDYSDELIDYFIKGYVSNSIIDLTPEKVKGYAIYKILKILCKVKGAPKRIQQEWIRRLNWTLEIDFLQGN